MRFIQYLIIGKNQVFGKLLTNQKIAHKIVKPGAPIRVPHQLQGTRHLDDHYDHIHSQGYRPSVTRYDLRPLILPHKSLAPIR